VDPIVEVVTIKYLVGSFRVHLMHVATRISNDKTLATYTVINYY